MSTSAAIKAAWGLGSTLTVRVREPSHGGWFCFDVEVEQFGSIRRYMDIKDDSRWFHRVWHRLARPFRRWGHA